MFRRSSFLVIPRLWLTQIMSFICISEFPPVGSNKRLKLKTRFVWIYKRNLHKPPNPIPQERCCRMHKSSGPTNTHITSQSMYNRAYACFEFSIQSAGESKMENANVILMKKAVDAGADPVRAINSVCHSRKLTPGIAYTQRRKLSGLVKSVRVDWVRERRLKISCMFHHFLIVLAEREIPPLSP